ncbi:hypothetical protein ACLOJK_002263 [Asimina triloba]
MLIQILSGIITTSSYPSIITSSPAGRSRLQPKSSLGLFTDELVKWGKTTAISRHATINLQRFPLQELEKATNNFSRECLLGSGAFGNVYRGTFEGDGTLAIKRAHADSHQSLDEFLNEVELLSRVKHRNLLGLVGFCDELRKRQTWEEKSTSLLKLIGRRGKTLTWRQRMNIAVGAAKGDHGVTALAGIAHLHEGVKPSIIHRDIKPSNILIGDGFEAKVSDFGLVRSGPTGDASHVSSQIKGTPGYLDPAYCSSYHLTPFSDVYSFGVILLQLVAAKPAVDTQRKHTEPHIIDWVRPSIESGAIEEILDEKLLMMPSCNMQVMLKMAELGLKCVAKLPRERPTMTQVWQELEAVLLSTDDDIPSSIQENTASKGSYGSATFEDFQQSVSVNRVGLESFHVEMDSISFGSTSLRCLETNSIGSIDVGKHDLVGIREESEAVGDNTPPVMRSH